MPRPSPRFHGFIGHKKKVDLLRRQLDGAMARHEAFPHSLLTGPSGVGKTLLAEALAEEYGTDIAKTMGYAKWSALAERLVGLGHNDFLFIDESHHLKPVVQDKLFQVIDNRRVATYDAEAAKATASAQTSGDREVEIPPFTLILATDQPGKLLNALHKRLPIQIALNYYPSGELKEIVDRVAKELDLLLSPQAAGQIARASCGLPRQAKHLLNNLRFHFPDSEHRQIGVAEVSKFLSDFDIDGQGFGPEHLRYARYLADVGTGSLETLSLHLGIDCDFVRRQIEQALIRERFITINSRGRELTLRGREWLSQRRDREHEE